ncbi:MAG TPA: L,D-transpeptidase [Kofleriaceae bacterium]|nr:L,D-transpeptidase [Kofleriaceae bacterium]
MTRLATLLSLTVLAGIANGCADNPGVGEDPEYGSGEGVDYDEENPNAPLDDGKSDAPRYQIPTNLPELVSPEIIVSLDGLTVHLFDRATGFSEVYPAGVGQKNSRGISITPTGHFKSGADGNDGWWYAPRRTVPDYFGGFPFLRTTARNSDGANTYALHGPITATLQRGYVSHGCVRMRGNDIVRLFWMVKKHPNTPITIQKEWERDAAGKKVDVGTNPTLWPVGAQITFGASVGPRPF